MQTGHIILHYHILRYFVGQVSRLGRSNIIIFLLNFLPTGWPAVPGPLSAPRKSIEPLRDSMIRVARRHWHSFLQNCCGVALRCMSACPPWESRASALACLTAIMGAEKSELTPLSFLLVFFTHVKKLSVTRLTNSSGRTLCLHTHTNTTLTHSGSEGAGMKRVIHSLKLHILIPSCVCPRFGLFSYFVSSCHETSSAASIATLILGDIDKILDFSPGLRSPSPSNIPPSTGPVVNVFNSQDDLFSLPLFFF